MRKFLYLYFSQYQCIRQFLGGKWAKDHREGYQWVSWEESSPRLKEHLELIGWPLNPKEYECESWE